MIFVFCDLLRLCSSKWHVSHRTTYPKRPKTHQIRFVDTDLLGQFPDQFQPYLNFGCTLRERFPGTLFRFPLRTPELARESEISKSCYDAGTVKELFASFQVNFCPLQCRLCWLIHLHVAYC